MAYFRYDTEKLEALMAADELFLKKHGQRLENRFKIYLFMNN